jgi:CBS domain-containing protein
MSRLADALGLTPSELLALVGEGEPIDAVAAPPLQSMPAMRDPVTMNAWDPEWIPPSRAQVQMMSPWYGVRRFSPPTRDVRLLDVLVGSEVMTADADEPIGPVVERMYERAYSQVPVYRAKNLVGLLTNDSVARWLGSSQSRSRRSEKATVAEVLAMAEVGQPFELVHEGATVRDALVLFDRAMTEGAPLAAVVVTKAGDASGKPLGIVTVADLPRLRMV